MNNTIKVLLVDDNASILKTMSFALTYRGHDVTVASNGEEAIQLVQQQEFDIVFMDVKMPAMNGVEAYKRIKEIKPGIIVVMMTAYSVEALLDEALKEGAYAVLHKPLDIHHIVSLIDRAVLSKKGIFILVVDDDESICTTLNSILTREGYKVKMTYTGEDAILMVKETDYEVIIIDMKLPLLNGLETYYEIKKINKKANIIFATGYFQELSDLVDCALQTDAYAVITKPIDMEKLIQMIETIVKRKNHGKS